MPRPAGLSAPQVVFAHRWLTTGTVILAEELATPQAHRYVPVVFLPAVPHAADPAARYGVTVIRTLTSIKAYGDLHTRLGPNTVLTYGPAWAGAMTEITEALSHITLDSPDPSPKLPFWDKAVGDEPQERRRSSRPLTAAVGIAEKREGLGSRASGSGCCCTGRTASRRTCSPCVCWATRTRTTWATGSTCASSAAPRPPSTGRASPSLRSRSPVRPRQSVPGGLS